MLFYLNNREQPGLNIALKNVRLGSRAHNLALRIVSLSDDLSKRN